MIQSVHFVVKKEWPDKNLGRSKHFSRHTRAPANKCKNPPTHPQLMGVESVHRFYSIRVCLFNGFYRIYFNAHSLSAPIPTFSWNVKIVQQRTVKSKLSSYVIDEPDVRVLERGILNKWETREPGNGRDVMWIPSVPDIRSNWVKLKLLKMKRCEIYCNLS